MLNECKIDSPMHSSSRLTGNGIECGPNAYQCLCSVTQFIKDVGLDISHLFSLCFSELLELQDDTSEDSIKATCVQLAKLAQTADQLANLHEHQRQLLLQFKMYASILLRISL